LVVGSPSFAAVESEPDPAAVVADNMGGGEEKEEEFAVEAAEAADIAEDEDRERARE